MVFFLFFCTSILNGTSDTIVPSHIGLFQKLGTIPKEDMGIPKKLPTFFIARVKKKTGESPMFLIIFDTEMGNPISVLFLTLPI